MCKYARTAVSVLLHVQALHDKQCSREELKQRAVALEHMGIIFLEVGNKALEATAGKDVDGSNQQDLAAQRIEKALHVSLCARHSTIHASFISMHSFPGCELELVDTSVCAATREAHTACEVAWQVVENRKRACIAACSSSGGVQETLEKMDRDERGASSEPSSSSPTAAATAAAT